MSTYYEIITELENLEVWEVLQMEQANAFIQPGGLE
jgi:hypothetical protein